MIKKQGQVVSRYPLERGLCLMLMSLVAALLMCDKFHYNGPFPTNWKSFCPAATINF